MWTLRAVAAGHGGDAVPLAVVAGLLWRTGPAKDRRATATVAAEARGLIRARLGGHDLPPEQAQSWARAAYALLGQLDHPESLLERAEELLRDVGAAALIPASALLPGSYAARLRDFAQAVRRALPAPGPETLHQAETAYARLTEHELAAADRRTGVARMALRLLRWLAVPDEPAATLADALHDQIRTGAYAEWAVAEVGGGDPDGQVATAYQALLDAVAVRRDARDRVLARHLAVAGVPAARLRTVLAAVRRVLSVDGYDPIAYDHDGVTVVLDVNVLAEQFGVTAP